MRASAADRLQAPHWALLPLLAGVLIGMAFSTAFLVRPYAESITTNIYLQLPETDGTVDRLDELKQMLADLQVTRHVSGVEKLSEEVKVKDSVYYAVVMNNRHSSEQLRVLRDTWTRDVPIDRVGFFIPVEKEEKEEEGEGERDEEEWEDVHYGEIRLSESDPVTLVELQGTHSNLFLDVVSYMCKSKLNGTKWFFLAGDDVYVKSQALEKFLQQYENQPSTGYLGRPDTVSASGVCVAGPGVVLSYPVLSALCSKLDMCSEKQGEGEGVIGHCVKEELGLDCSKEVQGEEHFLLVDLAQHSSITDEVSHHLLDTALTVFPVTEPKEMYHVHQFVVGRKLNRTQHEMRELKWMLDRMTELLPQSDHKLQAGYKERVEVTSTDDILPWQLVNHNVLMSDEENVPTRDIPGSWNTELELVMQKAVQYLNAQSESEHIHRRIVNAYWRVDPTVGIHYIIDFEASSPDDEKWAAQPKRHRGTFTRPLNAPEVSPPLPPSSSGQYVTIAVCLTSEHTTELQEFMTRLEMVLDRDQKVNLIVVQMRSPGQKQKPRRATNVIDPKSILSLYKTKYRSASFTVLDTPSLLSRSHGIAVVLRESRPSEVLFLADLDLDFDGSFLERCRTIPLQGQQVYFPVIFSQNSPSLLASFNHSLLDSSITQYSGHWLAQSYNTACIYAADLLAVSAQSELKGISSDVNLMEVYKGLLEKKYEIIRAPDKRLKRIHSDKRKCDLDFIGLSHDPCGVSRDSYETEYLKSQLSVLLFDHEGIYSENKY